MDNGRTINLCYGKGSLTLSVKASARRHVLEPRESSPLPDLTAAFQQACREPLNSAPLREIVQPHERVVIVTADGTRPLPNRILLPLLLAELPVPDENVTILLGNGGHRPNTPDELRLMFGDEIVRRVRIVNHDAFDQSQLTPVGRAGDGSPIILNKHYLAADRRIAVGLIEPHFFVGYSGGDKAVVPGVAGMETILHLHRRELIADARSTWGTLEENPIRRLLEEMVAVCPLDFLLNVTVDAANAVTGIFAGDHLAAHRAGCARVKEHAFVTVEQRYALVVTSNCGYPLDQNIYQAVKGIAAAANIVRDDGAILLCAECADGFAGHRHFAESMKQGDTAEDVLSWIAAQPATVIDQWQAQILAQILARVPVYVCSAMPAEQLRAIKLRPIDDPSAFIEERSGERGIAVLPAGFQTVPVYRA
ncbi:MAG TPA: nickel-dependent lactate racemase [bacterium]|nr:nickel-dependent lactate racemase [bacterium]